MNTGLLLCDHVAEQYRSIAGGYEDMFRALLPKLKMTPYYVCDGEFPEAPDACDAYICTGSKYSVYDDLDWIHRLKAFVRGIRSQEKPYVGVCFGHQLLAEALGGKVEPAPGGWSIGVHKFRIAQREKWMEPFQPRVNLLMLCQDQVQQLPSGSTVLAHTTGCPVGMFRVGERMLGIQAHPEFTAEYNQAVFEDRVDRIGIDKILDARDSLELPVHGKVVADWIGKFLK